MPTVKCPHCERKIELVGSSDIESQYGITSNMVTYAVRTNRFPEPWINFENRIIWLRSDIEKYAEGLLDEQAERLARRMVGPLSGLPDNVAQEARERAIKLLSTGLPGEEKESPKPVRGRKKS